MTNQPTDKMPEFRLCPVNTETMDKLWEQEIYGIPTYICVEDGRVWPHPKQMTITRYQDALREAMEALMILKPFADAFPNDGHIKQITNEALTTINALLKDK